MTHTGLMGQLSTRATSVIVAHRDDDTRFALRTLLEDSGYTVLLASDPDTSLDAVRGLTESAIVLFEMEPLGQAGGGFLELALLLASRRDAGASAPRRAFIALTTSPEHLARPLLRLLRTLDVPLVTEPFDSDELVRIVTRAASRCLETLPDGDDGDKTAESAVSASVPPMTQVRRPRT